MRISMRGREQRQVCGLDDRRARASPRSELLDAAGGKAVRPRQRQEMKNEGRDGQGDKMPDLVRAKCATKPDAAG